MISMNIYRKSDYEKVVSMAAEIINFLDGEIYRFDIQRVERNGIIFYHGVLDIENQRWIISSRGKIYMEEVLR